MSHSTIVSFDNSTPTYFNFSTSFNEVPLIFTAQCSFCLERSRTSVFFEVICMPPIGHSAANRSRARWSPPLNDANRATSSANSRDSTLVTVWCGASTGDSLHTNNEHEWRQHTSTRTRNESPTYCH